MNHECGTENTLDMLVFIDLPTIYTVLVIKLCFIRTIDFIECTDNSTCDENALCNNITGIPVCTCNEGFIGNGSICEGKYSQHIFYCWEILVVLFCYLFVLL